MPKYNQTKVNPQRNPVISDAVIKKGLVEFLEKEGTGTADIMVGSHNVRVKRMSSIISSMRKIR